MEIKHIDHTYNPYFSIHTFNRSVRSHIYIIDNPDLSYIRRHCYETKQLNKLVDKVKRY